MLDNVRLWIPIIGAFVVLLIFAWGYGEAIISSLWPDSLWQGSTVRDEFATAAASIIVSIVAGAFGFNMAVSTPDAPSLGSKGAQGAAAARSAESLATGTTVRATAATQALAKVVTPQGLTTPVAIKDTIIAIFAIVYMFIGFLCLITLFIKGSSIISKVKNLAYMTFGIIGGLVTAMLA
jgi:hypothetical protein